MPVITMAKTEMYTRIIHPLRQSDQVMLKCFKKNAMPMSPRQNNMAVQKVALNWSDSIEFIFVQLDSPRCPRL
ncbi:uncharacterized protein PHALS_14571 [Plasmopara halstedii]|uniref:Uncharacterized protein n=1 Tax=Plasmopara halstedii TaxID=4781 RepID=A0A0P1ALF3_PLAHL|nr:uncharacterized protein PHALS_14571 [Plasmopara halstedii]CEG41826.1 hypothetical protein PHALS_14571 [Plasmopara halstedii]|eukprot:XP_024578195.1 hypothetical protein PHALS_14571 [Plasmopara halstedii]